MIVVDTTVLAYAKGAEHPLRESCRALVAAVAEGRLEASTTVEVIQEFVHVRARRRGRVDAVTLGEDYAEVFAPLLSIGRDQLQMGLSLFERCDELGAFDAVLAAGAIDIGASALVSADSGFASVPRLRHVVPDAAGLKALIAG